MSDKKRREPGEAINPDVHPDVVEVTPLGAGQEVGRSCIVLKYRYITNQNDGVVRHNRCPTGAGWLCLIVASTPD